MKESCELISTLEDLVDKLTLSGVLQGLVEICDDKAEHLLVNWQDKITAKAWTQDAKKLDAVANKLNN